MKKRLPEGWQHKDLGEISHVIMGQSPESSSYNEKENGLPFYQGKAEFGKRHPTPVKWCTNPKKLAKKNDILMSVRAPVGPVNIANEECCIGRGLCAIRPNNGIKHLYVYHFLRFNEERISEKGQGSTFTAIGKDEVAKITIPVPPSVKIQEKIVSILEKAEETKQWRTETDELTKDLLKAVFVEMFGDPKANKKRWPVVKIENCIDIAQYGTSAKSNNEKKGYPIFGMNCISSDGELDISKHSYVELTKEEYQKLRLNKGDVIFNRTNSPELVGKVAYWDYNMNAVIASYLVKLILKNNCDPIFLTFLLNTSYFKEIFYSSSKKAVNQANISPTLLKTFEMYLPPLSLQQKFASIVKEAEQMKEHQKQSKEQTDNLFSALLQKSFTGELVA
jgi:type I restriction enzyme S subunit